MDELISIVMAYYNRKVQLIRTLETISLSSYKNIEIIIVDDASDSSHELDDIIYNFRFPIRLIKIQKDDKKWINPCIPFNIGLKAINGKYVIIQNPECLHYGDIINHISKNINDYIYISLSCYSIDKNTTDKITGVTTKELDKVIRPLGNTSEISRKKEPNRWYNHPVLRPAAYHFVSAISSKNLSKIGLFDERFFDGFCYDDDEFIGRIRKNKINVIITDPSIDIFAIHQWHLGGTSALKSQYAIQKEKNRNLLIKINNEER